MFKSFLVRFETEQKARDVPANYAGPSRLDWWTPEEESGWSFTAQTLTAEKGWSKFLQFEVDSKSLHAFNNQLDQFMERKSTLSMNCGDTTVVESGSWDTISRKYRRFLSLTDCWWAWDTGPDGYGLIRPFLHFYETRILCNRCYNVPVWVYVGHGGQEAQKN